MFTGSIYGYPGGTGTVTDFNYAKGAPGTAGGGGTYRDGGHHNGAGGGAGDQNGNSANTRKMTGGTDGGIVMVRSGSLSGGGTIDVRGGVANDNPGNDAAGAAQPGAAFW